MPSLIWDGFHRDFPETKPEALPESAQKIRIPQNNMTVSVLLAVPFMLLLFAALIVKTPLYHDRLNNPVGVFLGILLGFCLIPVHELLHAAVYPQNAAVRIGFLPQKLIAYISCPAPLSRPCFLLMSLLPMVLGGIPFVLFLLSPPDQVFAQCLLWPCAMMGLVSPSPDYLNVFCVLRQTPKNAVIQDGSDGIYWYLPKRQTAGRSLP